VSGSHINGAGDLSAYHFLCIRKNRFKIVLANFFGPLLSHRKFDIWRLVCFLVSMSEDNC
jgi:hypothetical protein